MARARPNPPVIHLIVALLVVLAPALLAVAWFQRIPEPPVTAVDPAPVVAAARASGAVVAAPANLPDGWVCTRARWTPAGQPGVSGTPSPGDALGLGYLSPARLYVAVDSSDAPSAAFVTSVTRSGHPDGSSELAGRTWQRHVSADGRTRSLVLTVEGRTTIVSADAGYEAVEAFAQTLDWSGRA